MFSKLTVNAGSVQGATFIVKALKRLSDYIISFYFNILSLFLLSVVFRVKHTT